MSAKAVLDNSLYSGRTPFDILGVSASATAKDIQDAQAEKLDDIDFAGHDDATRIAKRDEIKAAYNAIREAKQRAALKVFVFDPAMGEKEAKTVAARHKSLKFPFERILKGSAEVLPASLDIPDVRKQYREVTFEQSVHLESRPAGQAIDLKAEMIKSIRFER